MGIKTNTTRIDGDASEVVAAVEDGHRQYLGLYAQFGSCIISVGNGVHATEAITIAQGNIFEPSIAFGDIIYYSGANTQLLVINDIDRLTILTYTNLPLTYDGTPLAYRHNDYDTRLDGPVFI